jgi:hypothetical protein
MRLFFLLFLIYINFYNTHHNCNIIPIPKVCNITEKGETVYFTKYNFNIKYEFFLIFSYFNKFGNVIIFNRFLERIKINNFEKLFYEWDWEEVKPDEQDNLEPRIANLDIYINDLK